MAREELLASIPPGSPDEALARRVDPDRLPAHIAIIMDGNGRWAAQRHLPRVRGHEAGVEAVRDAVETSARLGISVLTLYAFSTENWKRPQLEVTTLMRLLKRYLKRERQDARQARHPVPGDWPAGGAAPGRPEGAGASARRDGVLRRACGSTSRSTTAGGRRSSTPRAA